MSNDYDELLLGGQDRKGTSWLASSRGAGPPRVWPFPTPGTTTTLPALSLPMPPSYSHSQKPGTGEFHQEGKRRLRESLWQVDVKQVPCEGFRGLHAGLLYSKSQSATPLPPKMGSPLLSGSQMPVW